MEHKTKVIAVRVTQEQHDALIAVANGRKIGQYVYSYLMPAIMQGRELIAKERKKAEAKAKRDAKKAAANGVQ